MNRYKKELLKQIDTIDRHIAAEEEMGCGFTPAWFLDELEDLKKPLYKKLAELSHYASVYDYRYDIKNPLSWINTRFSLT